MRILSLILLGICLSAAADSRIVVHSPKPKVIEITERDAHDLGIYPEYKFKSDLEGSILVFDLTSGIDGKEVSSARITLYASEYEITNFSTSLGELIYENGTHMKGFGVAINRNVVTSLEVDFYVEGPVTYVLSLSTESL